MKNRNTLYRVLTTLLMVWLGFGAACGQIVVNGEEYKGKMITLLHFDGEEVTVKLNDGTIIGSVYQLSALIDKDAAIREVDYESPWQPGDGCYDLLGRRLGAGRWPSMWIERKGGRTAVCVGQKRRVGLSEEKGGGSYDSDRR